MAEEDKVIRKRGGIEQYLSGRILSNRAFVRRLPLILYVGILIIIYMTITFRLQSKYEYVDDLKNELSILRTIAVTTSEERVKRSNKKEIERLLEEFNIKLIEFDERPYIVE